MGNNFDAAFDFIMEPQRDGYQQDSAPGETFRTSWGIIQATWDDAVERELVTGKLEDATKAQAQAIYFASFWNAMCCSLLPDGLDVLMFDQGTLSGTGRAARILQHIVGAGEDGVIGPKTLALVGVAEPRSLIDAQAADFLTFLATLSNWATFSAGWTTRETAAKALAYKLGVTVEAPGSELAALTAAVERNTAVLGDLLDRMAAAGKALEK